MCDKIGGGVAACDGNVLVGVCISHCSDMACFWDTFVNSLYKVVNYTTTYYYYYYYYYKFTEVE